MQNYKNILQYIKDIQAYNRILQNKNFKLSQQTEIYKKELQIYSKQEDYIRNLLTRKYKENYQLKTFINQYLKHTNTF